VSDDSGFEIAARADRAKATDIATRAYQAAAGGDWPAANRAMAEAGRQTPNVIALVLTRFCDTIIGLQRDITGMPPVADGADTDGPVRPLWFNADTGQATMDADAEDLPAAVRWAGQLIAARAALDLDGFQALLSAMTDDARQRGEYANTLLMTCAATGKLAALHRLAEPGGAA
jgi:hypothetical protein